MTTNAPASAPERIEYQEARTLAYKLVQTSKETVDANDAAFISRCFLAVLHKYQNTRTAPNTAHGWLPIETAPKDGTEILVFAANRPEGKQCIVAWWKKTGWAFLHWNNTVFYTHDEITHWRPLPAAPEKVGE